MDWIGVGQCIGLLKSEGKVNRKVPFLASFQVAECAPTLGRRRRKTEGEEGSLVLDLFPKGEVETRRLRHDVPRPHRPPGELT